jgi:hypothetical protein
VREAEEFLLLEAVARERLMKTLRAGENFVFRRKQCAYFGFSKRRPLPKHTVVTELNIEKIPLQIILSDVC